MTPAHIVPEWYFLPFYAILRSVPSKLGGVLALLGAIFALLALPYIGCVDSRSGMFRPLYKFAFFSFVGVTVILGWIGSMPIAYPYLWIGRIATLLYFLLLLIILPYTIVWEAFLIDPKYDFYLRGSIRELIMEGYLGYDRFIWWDCYLKYYDRVRRWNKWEFNRAYRRVRALQRLLRINKTVRGSYLAFKKPKEKPYY